MKIREDRSHMNIDTRWFEKGYAKEDVHSLRLQSLCTEAEAAANKQFYDSHTCEEWEQYIRQASLESSAAMKPVMEAIAQDFVCYQYDENIPVSYGSDRWDLYFWCNPFSGAADASERDFSYFTLTFNERQTLEKRKKVCQQVLDLLCSRFQEHPNLNVCLYRCLIFLADPVGFGIPVLPLPVQSVQLGFAPFLYQAVIGNKLPLFFIQIHFIGRITPIQAKMLWEKESHLQYSILFDTSQIGIILTDFPNISVVSFFLSWQV